MKLKLDEEGHVVVEGKGADAKPIYVHDDGKEIPFDAPQAIATIKRISDERDDQRKAAEKVAAALAVYEDIDAEKARKALQTVADLEKGELLTADKVDQLRREIGDQYKEELEKAKTDSQRALEAAKTEATKLKAKLDDQALDRAFGTSKFAKNLAYPSTVARAYFGQHFRITPDGTIEARDGKGDPISSIERPGEKAGFEEALSIIVNALPDKDSHLKAPEARGTETGTPGGAVNGRVKTRSEFRALPAAGRDKFLEEGGTLTD